MITRKVLTTDKWSESYEKMHGKFALVAEIFRFIIPRELMLSGLQKCYAARDEIRQCTIFVQLQFDWKAFINFTYRFYSFGPKKSKRDEIGKYETFCGTQKRHTKISFSIFQIRRGVWKLLVQFGACRISLLLKRKFFIRNFCDVVNIFENLTTLN